MTMTPEFQMSNSLMTQSRSGVKLSHHYNLYKYFQVNCRTNGLVGWSTNYSPTQSTLPSLTLCFVLGPHAHTYIALEPANLPVLQCFCSEINISAVTCSYVIDNLLFMKWTQHFCHNPLTWNQHFLCGHTFMQNQHNWAFALCKIYVLLIKWTQHLCHVCWTLKVTEMVLFTLWLLCLVLLSFHCSCLLTINQSVLYHVI